MFGVIDMKKCVIILPYFGKFNNYFQLFLRSCGYNKSYTFLIFTDNESVYDYPDNVKKIAMTLNDFKKNVEKKIGFRPCIPDAYKLCDFKPAYGLLFEEYIKGYEYWGHCDCDLIFGDLEKSLNPLLERDFDKIFAAGHLTIYRNTYENNRRFMKPVNGMLLYRDVFMDSRIRVFDEDNPDINKNPKGHNVHEIFLKDGANLYTKDLSFNVPASHDHLTRSVYNSNARDFIEEPVLPCRIFWNNGRIVSFKLISNNRIEHSEYLYIHLQKRKMRCNRHVSASSIIEICPDRFRSVQHLPLVLKDMHLMLWRLPSSFWIHIYIGKFRHKIKRIISFFK